MRRGAVTLMRNKLRLSIIVVAILVPWSATIPHVAGFATAPFQGRKIAPFFAHVQSGPWDQPRTRLVELDSSGRVKDPDDWLRLCSNSLEQSTGLPLTHYMEDSKTGEVVERLDQVHNNERWAVLSHGSQEDPIYCYFNKAAFAIFKFAKSEVYQLPSRYSARSGNDRARRQAILDGTADRQAIQTATTNSPATSNGRSRQSVADGTAELGFVNIQRAVRQAGNGDIFEIPDVLLWNVYDDEGFRVGQSAIFDLETVIPLDAAASDDKE